MIHIHITFSKKDMDMRIPVKSSAKSMKSDDKAGNVLDISISLSNRRMIKQSLLILGIESINDSMAGSVKKKTKPVFVKVEPSSKRFIDSKNNMSVRDIECMIGNERSM